jgi:hypothetical protein
MYLDKSIATCKAIVSLLLQKCRASNRNFGALMKKKEKIHNMPDQEALESS